MTRAVIEECGVQSKLQDYTPVAFMELLHELLSITMDATSHLKSLSPQTAPAVADGSTSLAPTG